MEFLCLQYFYVFLTAVTNGIYLCLQGVQQGLADLGGKLAEV